MNKLLIPFFLSLAASSYAGNMNMPTRGTSMDAVLSMSGEPQQKRDAVGEPPITRWDYADYTVYFEHQTVIHTVKNKKK
jgi:hypothetical protein